MYERVCILTCTHDYALPWSPGYHSLTRSTRPCSVPLSFALSLRPFQNAQSLAFQQLAGMARRGELRDYGEEMTAEVYRVR